MKTAWMRRDRAVARFETDFGALVSLLDQQGVTLGGAATLFHRAVASDGSFTTPGPAAQARLTRGTITAAEDEAGVPKTYVLA